MSDVKRYIAIGDSEECADGPWVSYEDYIEKAAIVDAIELFMQMDGVSPHTKLVAIRGVLGVPIWDAKSHLKP